MTFENYNKYKISIQLDDLIQLHRVFQVSASLVGTQEVKNQYSTFKSLHGFGAKQIIQPLNGTFFQEVEQTVEPKPAFYFMCLGYDLKNEIENLKSENEEILNLPNSFIFEPKYVVLENNLGQYSLYVQSEQEKQEFEQIFDKASHQPKIDCKQSKIELQPQITKQDYLNGFQKVRHHIQQGDFYEMNYCQAFTQENIDVNPLQLFQRVYQVAKAPFMAFLQKNEQFLISASPERYIKKQGAKIISQPIKGTVKRGETPKEDEVNKSFLKTSLKEKTENVMIVDLVRNDFGKICKAGSVEVEELFGVYSYPTVHQLVSTVVGNLKENTTFSEILRATFPMGSMTGAPKYRVMQITEEIEAFKRGWYSGSVGYLLPTGDFDFNVIIRSFIYDSTLKKLFYGVGGGITASSKAENEYDECLLKVNSLVDKLNDL